MQHAPDMSLWRGRSDAEESGVAERWHETIQPWADSAELPTGTALLGFSCDEGVRRNQGRTGAQEGPAALRRALANLVRPREQHLYDAGDIVCEGEALEEAQEQLAQRVAQLLHRGDRAILLGGGHEMALGSHLGLTHFLQSADPPRAIGIINLDGHFDLRSPVPRGTSGSSFRQIAERCCERAQPFRYMALGINPAANTRALFQYAIDRDVRWFTDLECTPDRLPVIEHSLTTFIAQLEELHLSICLDVLPAAHAPGVSAPGAPGVDPVVVIDLIQTIKALASQHDVALRICDVAELNPGYDPDGRTALLAARLVHEIVS